MKYQGHPHVKKYAKSCPACGHWLEHADNVDRPFPEGMWKCVAVALVVEAPVHLLFGVVPGIVAGGLGLFGSAWLLLPRDPDYFCFGCNKFWSESEVAETGPKV
jgi:hypothetical protein